MRQTEIALANTHQHRFGPDRVQKTFSPQGSGQVPTIVPSLLSGVAPATPPPESVPRCRIGALKTGLPGRNRRNRSTSFGRKRRN
jgi:hypothetical protein